MNENNKWTVVYDDAGTWKSVRKAEVPIKNSRVYHAAEILDLEYHLPDHEYQEMIDNGGARFSGALYEIDLDVVDVAEALRCCDLDQQPDLDDFQRACACLDYGAYAPMGTFDGPLEEQVKDELHDLSFELVMIPERREQQLQRPVNKLGSTAREYALGDFTGTVKRRLLELCAHPEQPLDPELLISARLHNLCLIVDGRPADWLPYAMGFIQGEAGNPPTQPESDDPGDAIAPEYYQGYRYGELVHAGVAKRPGWIMRSGPTTPPPPVKKDDENKPEDGCGAYGCSRR